MSSEMWWKTTLIGLHFILTEIFRFNRGRRSSGKVVLDSTEDKSLLFTFLDLIVMIKQQMDPSHSGNRFKTHWSRVLKSWSKSIWHIWLWLVQLLYLSLLWDCLVLTHLLSRSQDPIPVVRNFLHSECECTDAADEHVYILREFRDTCDQGSRFHSRITGTKKRWKRNPPCWSPTQRVVEQWVKCRGIFSIGFIIQLFLPRPVSYVYIN